jgi:putative ATP-dependent endonuclease of the OLD family
MKLASMRLRNFRCYREEAKVDFDDLTALIGRNDAGKSTLMEALDIFLNDGKLDEHDASKGGDAKDLTIICEFSDLPDEVVVDDANPTSLAVEHLLNGRGQLEIHKKYSGDLKSPKCKSICAFARHPRAAGVADLLKLKNKGLKGRAEELGVDLSSADSKVNAELRQAIRDHVGELDLGDAEVPLDADNAKSIWDGLKTYLPAFALFKSDRQSTDQDAEAQDPLKAAVKEAIKSKQKEFDDLADYVRDEVGKVADLTQEKLREMNPSLATELETDIPQPNWSTGFKTSIIGDEGIPFGKRGSGVRRLILLNFFRAKVELQLKEPDAPPVIYGIEEPETAQHPDNQRMLMQALTDLSSGAQIVLSTHTPMLARSLPDGCLRYIKVLESGQREIMAGEDTLEECASALGVLPDNGIKLFIGVEGKHDITFLKRISKVLVDGGENVLDLTQMELDGEVIFFPFGGSNLALWTARLQELKRPEFHVYDRDHPPPRPAKYHREADEVNARKNCRAQITEKREMENYLHPEAIHEAYHARHGVYLRLPTVFGDFDDVPKEVAKLAHDASRKLSAKDGAAKKVLNDLAASHMTLERLVEVDPAGDVLGWFRDMQELIDGANGAKA